MLLKNPKHSLPFFHFILAFNWLIGPVLAGLVPPPNGAGSAVSFDGVNDFLSASPVSLPSGNSPYTIEAWIKTTRTSGAITAWGNFGTPNQVNAFLLTSTGLVNVWAGNDLEVSVRLTGVWHHVAATFDGVTRQILVDGTVRGSDTPTGHRAGAGGFTIGAANGVLPFFGFMDEVRIWNIARSPAEIRDAMRRQIWGNENGLIANWRLDEGVGIKAHDATGKDANTAILMNGADWAASTIVPFAAHVSTLDAESLAPSIATLRGQVDGLSSTATFGAFFEWGSTPESLQQVPPGFVLAPGSPPANLSTPLTGLLGGTTYFYRLTATNVEGSSYGVTRSFRTPSTLTVVNLQDNGPGSLRQAVLDAKFGDEITFAPGLSGTIGLTSGEIVIPTSLSLHGPGAAVLTISGSHISRVLRVAAPNVSLSGLRFADGQAPPAVDGGGIRIESTGAAITNCVFANNAAGSSPADGGGVAVVLGGGLILDGCTLLENQADSGGAVSVSFQSSLSAARCTFSKNHALAVGGKGGAIRSRGTAVLESCTIAGNIAASFGGVYRDDGTISLHNSIVAANQGGSDSDLDASVTSMGFNLVGTAPPGLTLTNTDLAGIFGTPLDPLLGLPADNGGSTPTMALTLYSPAVDVGDDRLSDPFDQRGFPRRAGCHVDIGAYELVPPDRDPKVVRNLNDGGPGSLRDAIACAAPGGTVVFKPGLTGNIGLWGNTIVFAKDISIIGPGADQISISGLSVTNGRLFCVASDAHVTVSGLSILRGVAFGYAGASASGPLQSGQPGQNAVGGAFLNLGHLILSDCRLAFHRAWALGGGDGALDSGVIPPSYGGMGGSAMGGAICNSNALELLRCEFATNKCIAGPGGAGGDAFNSAQGIAGTGGTGGAALGGAIFNAGSIRMTACTFVGNSAQADKGGPGGNATDGKGRIGGKGGKGGWAAGGAIFNSEKAGVSIWATNCTFSSHLVSGGLGGTAGAGATGAGLGGDGGDAEGGALANLGSCDMVNDTIVFNNLVPGGPGFSTPTREGAPGIPRGQGLFAYNPQTRLLNTLIANVYPLNVVLPGGPDVVGTVESRGHNLIGIVTVSGAGSGGSSGWLNTDILGSESAPINPHIGPLATHGGFTFTHDLLPESQAVDAGDDTVTGPGSSLMTDQRGVYRPQNDHVDIGAFERCAGKRMVVSHTDDGTACCLRETIDNIVPDDAHPTVIEFAPWVRGKLKLTQGELLINGSVSINGPGPDQIAVSANFESRVIHVTKNPLAVTLTGLTIADGMVHGTEPVPTYGGGIWAESGVLLSRLTLIDCVVTNNTVEGVTGNPTRQPDQVLEYYWHALGGGIACGELVISNSVVVDNRVFGGLGWNRGDAAGGGVYSGYTVRANRCAFLRNRAVGGKGSNGRLGEPHALIAGFGGGLACGGGIFSTALYLDDCFVSENVALGGRGGDAGPGGYGTEAQPEEIAGVGGDGSGGGVMVGEIQVNRSTFSGNIAQGGAGGMGGYGDGNSRGGAPGVGSVGGVRSWGGPVEFQFLVNCTISGNKAIGGMPGPGGPATTLGERGPSGFSGFILACCGGVSGVYAMTNSTVFGNIADAATRDGLASEGGLDVIDLKSSIVAGNRAINGDRTKGEIQDYSPLVARIKFNLIGQLQDFNGSLDELASNHNLWGTAAAPLEPGLGPLRYNGGLWPTHALLPYSPARDAGKSDLATDQRGAPRNYDDPQRPNAPGGDGSDMGAVEDGNVRIVDLRQDQHDWVVCFTTWPNGEHIVQSRDTLGNEPWVNVAAPVTGNGAVVSISDDRPEATNRFYRVCPVSSGMDLWNSVYFNDFEGEVGSEWGTPINLSLTPVGRRRFLGEFSTQPASLHLINLPAHSRLRVSFDLFILKDWRGNGAPGGPQSFKVSLPGGPLIFQATFATHGSQSYPGALGENHPANVGADEVDTLGYTLIDDGNADAVYHISAVLDHQDSDVTIEFKGLSLQNVKANSWGLDNVGVDANTPE